MASVFNPCLSVAPADIRIIRLIRGFCRPTFPAKHRRTNVAYLASLENLSQRNVLFGVSDNSRCQRIFVCTTSPREIARQCKRFVALTP